MVKIYHIMNIPKGNGKFRTIYAPSKLYKRELKIANKIISKLIHKFDDTKTNHAFIKGRNCITNAEQHTGYNFTLSMDLEDFFDCVKDTMLEGYLKEDFLDLCFIDGIARQGLPTSPSISNLAFLKADNDIRDSLEKLNILYSYTRYADDITISLTQEKHLHKIIDIVRNIVEKHGFKINERKTKIQNGKNGRRMITGVAVDDKVYPTRKILKKIRAAKHQNNEDSLMGLVEWSKCKKPYKEV